jgi:hypothetical protein
VLIGGMLCLWQCQAQLPIACREHLQSIRHKNIFPHHHVHQGAGTRRCVNLLRKKASLVRCCPMPAHLVGPMFYYSTAVLLAHHNILLDLSGLCVQRKEAMRAVSSAAPTEAQTSSMVEEMFRKLNDNSSTQGDHSLRQVLQQCLKACTPMFWCVGADCHAIAVSVQWTFLSSLLRGSIYARCRKKTKDNWSILLLQAVLSLSPGVEGSMVCALCVLRRGFPALSHLCPAAGGAGGGTTLTALRKADEAWARLRTAKVRFQYLSGLTILHTRPEYQVLLCLTTRQS